MHYSPQKFGSWENEHLVSITTKGDVLLDDIMLKTDRERALAAILLRVNAARLIMQKKYEKLNKMYEELR